MCLQSAHYLRIFFSYSRRLGEPFRSDPGRSRYRAAVVWFLVRIFTPDHTTPRTNSMSHLWDTTKSPTCSSPFYSSPFTHRNLPPLHIDTFPTPQSIWSALLSKDFASRYPHWTVPLQCSCELSRRHGGIREVKSQQPWRMWASGERVELDRRC